MAKLTRNVEFLPDRTRLWTDIGLIEVPGDREQFAQWVEDTAYSKHPEQAIAIQLREHKKTDPQFANTSAITGKDYEVTMTVKEKDKVAK